MLRQTFAGALAGGLATVVLPSSAPVFPLASAGGLEAPGAADTLSVSLAAPAGGKVAEGASADFLVTLAGGPARSAVAVRYTVEGTADAGTDYQRLSGSVAVAAGDTVASITLAASRPAPLSR